MRNRSIPDVAVIPVLLYPDVRAAVAWLEKAFGFKERLQIADHRSQLEAFGGSVVAANGAGPHAIQPNTHSIMIRIPNADEHCERAQAAGAKITNPPTSYPFGERQYSAVDLAGHVWTFTQTIADIDPESWGGVLHSVR
jgi:uncharacterized glyoxalase superfamily protein PhnB